MSEWVETLLSTVVEIKHGFAFKGEYFKDAPPGDVLLTPGNFAIGGGFKGDKLKFYDGPAPDEFVLQAGDLLVTMTDLSKQADTLGYPLLVPRDSSKRYLHNQRLGKVEIKRDAKISAKFLYYLLQSFEYRHGVVAGATGTTVKHTSPTRIGQFKFRKPPLETQQAIANILSALDDKIDLNRRMNETLEQTARALFKDWFVNFGPTKAKMAGQAAYLEGELWGLFPERLDEEGVPKGWTTSSVGGAFRLIMGQSPPGNTYNETGDGLPFFQGRTDFGFRYPENRKFCSAPTRIAEADDTLVSVRAPVGDVNLAWEKCCVGRGVAALQHHSNSWSYTYHSAWSLQNDLRQYENTGTVFGAINKKQFEALAVVEPHPTLVVAFDEIVNPLDTRVQTNIRESRALAQTRNLLLPKLMSGELRVRDAEARVAEVL